MKKAIISVVLMLALIVTINDVRRVENTLPKPDPQAVYVPPEDLDYKKEIEWSYMDVIKTRYKGLLSEKALELIPYEIYTKADSTQIIDMAYTLWCEGRSVSAKGYSLIASVIINRVKSEFWPNSVVGVIHEKKQFSCWGEDGHTPIRKINSDYEEWSKALEVSYDYFYGFEIPTTNIYYYHRKEITTRWSKGLVAMEDDGDHIYFNRTSKYGR